MTGGLESVWIVGKKCPATTSSTTEELLGKVALAGQLLLLEKKYSVVNK